VGSGSGYLVAVLHHLVSPGGKVVGIDHIQELVDSSVDNLKMDGLDAALRSGEITMIVGDGRKGFSQSGASHLSIPFCSSLISSPQGPYDVIHVGAAAASLPKALVDQLASPGRMFIPVGSPSQNIEIVDKDHNGNVEKKKIMGVRVSSYSFLVNKNAESMGR
jgi:protein-L-isoaspartate(D-aspartate) O-methyltransferase